MAYNVIFTVSGAGSDTGPFNISGTTSLGVTTLIQSGVSKATLEAGYEVTIPDNTITGGTIASTGTCTTSQQWLKPSISLVVYMRDINNGSPTVLYKINSTGSTVNLPATITNTCSNVYTITGLSRFDQVIFSTVGGFVMNGVENDSNCPASSGSATEYTTNIGNTSPDTVAITINSAIAP